MQKPQTGLALNGIAARVLDGDTIEVTISEKFTVRLLDCWAPEVHGAEKPQGVISKAALQGILPSGASVTIFVPDHSKFSDNFTFGRVLGYVWVGNINISEYMVMNGYATSTKDQKTP